MRFNTLLMVLLAVVNMPAVAANSSVPGDYATIQEAVDAAAPGDVINVGPGNFAGAAIFKRVTIIGSPGTIIDQGNPVLFGGDDAFDIIFPGANGTTISDMTFTGGNFLWGVFALQADAVTVTNCVFLDTTFGVQGVNADNVTVENNVFLNTFHAVDNRWGNGWTVIDNVMDGFIPFPPPGSGVENHQEAILIVAPARDNRIEDNWIRHIGDLNPGYSLELNIGITLISFGGALENNTVEDNEVEVVVPDAEISDGVALIALGDSVAVMNNAIVDNGLCRSLNPIGLVPESLSATNLIDDNEVVCVDD